MGFVASANRINTSKSREEKSILVVANVAKEHILKFHLPTIKLLKERGWRVDVICGGSDDIPFVDNHIVAKWSRSPFTFGTITGLMQIRRQIDTSNYDIVYCHTPVGGLEARLGAFLSKKHLCVVYFAHGLHFFKDAPFINWIVFFPVEKLLARITDFFILINEEDYCSVRKTFHIDKSRILLSPGVGVELSRFCLDITGDERAIYRGQLGLDENTVALIYVAEILQNKNQQMLLKTLSLLKQRGRNVQLLLVGPEHDNGLIRKKIESLELQSYVKVLGWRKDVPQLLRAADIYVASSIREGFGINIVEAMASDLPVIATDNRGHRTIIKDGFNGFLVPINDYRRMATCVEKILDEQKLKKTIVNNAHASIDKYEEQVVTKMICDFLEEARHISKDAK